MLHRICIQTVSMKRAHPAIQFLGGEGQGDFGGNEQAPSQTHQSPSHRPLTAPHFVVYVFIVFYALFTVQCLILVR